MELSCLHGFLGAGSDWDFLRPRWQVDAPGLFVPADEAQPVLESLDEWAKRWTAELPRRRRVLVGYSLGGRLALHALAAAPHLFSGAILISAHPGLSSASERQARLAADAGWASRFRAERWGSVIEAWESQGIFAGTGRLPRAEDKYSRDKLSHALLGWSLGAQGDVLGRLAELATPPILWLAGERDAKFAMLARQAAHRIGEHRIVPEAGHRLPWDAPEAFRKILESFVKERIQ